MAERKITGRVLFVTFMTGACGLVYEVAWQRYFADLLGSQAKATALVLAVFLGGLGAGYALFGRLAQDRPASRLIRLSGMIEIGIGGWAFAFLGIYRLMRSHVGVLPPGLLLGDLAAAIALAGIPTLLMGATLPLLTQGLAQGSESETANARLHARVYSINTAGAFAGCLGAAFVLVPLLGLQGTIITTGLMNIAAGLCLMRLAAAVPEASAVPAPPAPRREEAPAIRRPAAFVIAALSGFCSLTLQPVFIRLLGLSMGPSEVAFAMVVAEFILLIAAGAWLFASRVRWPIWANQTLLVAGLVVLYALLPLWPYSFHVIRTLMPLRPEAFYLYHLLLFVLVLAALFVPIGTLGATLPLLIRELRLPYHQLGSTVGRLYAMNTAGSVLGAMLGGYVLMAHLDCDALYRLCTALAALSLILVLPLPRSLPRALPFTAALVGAAAPLFPGWDRARLGVGVYLQQQATDFSYRGPSAFYRDLFRELTVLEYRDDPNATVAVAQFTTPRPGAAPQISRSIMINGKPDGNTIGDRGIMSVLGHLPALLTGSENRRAAVVGFGTGMSVGALTLHPHIELIDTIEITPAVAAFAPYFDQANHGVSTNPKVRWQIEDAYRFFGATPQQYGVIVVQPSNPWMAGVERLYTREFNTLVRDHLAPGGIAAVWLPLTGLSNHAAAVVLSTAAAVYPALSVFTYDKSLIILGSAEPLGAAHLRRLEERSLAPNVHPELAQIGLGSPELIAALEAWLPQHSFREQPLHTQDLPRLGYYAARDFFMEREAAIETMLPRPDDWAYSLMYSQRSLLGLLAQRGVALPLQEIVRTSCGGLRVNLVEPNWRFIRTVCRDAIVALIAEGRAPAPEYLGGEFAWLAKFRNGQDTNAVLSKSIPRAIEEIGLFAQFDSIFNPLSSKRLLWNSAHCFSGRDKESFTCREYLIKALSRGGRLEEAAQQLSFLRRDFSEGVPASRWDEIERFVAQYRSEAATETDPKSPAATCAESARNPRA